MTRGRGRAGQRERTFRPAVASGQVRCRFDDSQRAADVSHFPEDRQSARQPLARRRLLACFAGNQAERQQRIAGTPAILNPLESLERLFVEGTGRGRRASQVLHARFSVERPGGPGGIAGAIALHARVAIDGDGAVSVAGLEGDGREVGEGADAGLRQPERAPDRHRFAKGAPGLVVALLGVIAHAKGIERDGLPVQIAESAIDVQGLARQRFALVRGRPWGRQSSRA